MNPPTSDSSAFVLGKSDSWLYWLVLSLTYLGATVALAGLFSLEVRSTIIHALTVAEAAAAGVVFLRSLLSAKFIRGFSAFARQKTAFQRATPWRQQLFDPNWGFWAKRYGPVPLRLIQVVVIVEVVGAVLGAHTRFDDVVFLAIATFFAATALGILYIGLHTEPERDCTSAT